MEHYQKEEHSSLRMQVPLCNRSGMTELSSDFSLPDYLPEIKRLLRVRATVLPPDKYIGAGNADFTGAIEYAILYSDNDGALYCVTERGEYQFAVPLDTVADIDLNDGLTCDSDVIPEAVSGRVAAPRKEPVKVKNAIYKNIARGTTELLSKSVYKNDDVVTLMCVMSSSEFFKMKPIIQEIDHKTFIYAVRATEVHEEG